VRAQAGYRGQGAQVLFVLGYDEIETPSMEYMDVFQGGVGDFEQERMFQVP